MDTANKFLDIVLSHHKDDPKTEGYKREVQRLFEEDLSPEERTKMLANEASVRVDIDTTDWDLVAVKTTLIESYRKSAELLGHDEADKYGKLEVLIDTLVEKGLYGSFLNEKYSKKEITKIGSFIKPERDELLSYIGLRLISDKYVARDHDNNLWELPQQRWIIIAMTVMQDEPKSKRLEYIEEAYWAMSNLFMTVATPTMSNSGKTHGQLSSCFIDIVEDSLDGIYSNNSDMARVSKFGGGVGVYMGKVRSLKSSIKGFKGKASGVIPWVRNLNNTAVAVDQLGQRQGAIAVYLDAWHKDILPFLQIGTNNGDERTKAFDVFTGVCIPDYFMELSEVDGTGRMANPNSPWYLFDPHEVREYMGWSLEDSYDEKRGSGTWRERYQQCIDHPLLSRAEVPIKVIWQAILTAQLETGHPFMFYRDEVNRQNANKHAGMIYSSNLCTEIFQNMTPTVLIDEYMSERGTIIKESAPGDFVVCNLSSINLGRAYRDGVIKRLIKIQVRMLDNVIDVNNLPLLQASRTNKKYRATGLGTFGWHHLLAISKIDWDDPRSIDLADEVYEEIAFYALTASVELAKEKGSYEAFEGSDFHTGEYFESREYKSEGSRFDWDGLKEDVKEGIRNGYLMAVAPNSTTAIIAGSTQGVDPFYGSQGVYFEEKKDLKMPVVAPDFSTETYQYYYKRNAHYVSQKVTILQNEKRQRHVDQGVSLNLYVPSTIKAKDLMDLHRQAWRVRTKTTYYVRGTANLDDCESCS